MATIRISVADAARDFTGLLARVRAGEEIVIESDSTPVAVLRAPAPARRTIPQVMAKLPDNDSMRMGPDFADDVEAAISALREPLNPPEWD